MKSKMNEYLLELNYKAVRKEPQSSSLKNLAYISFGLFLLTVSCDQSDNKSKNQAETNVETKTIIETPQMDIQTAILSDNLEAIEQHVKAGTDLNKKDTMSGATPLITAASFGKNKIAQILVDAGADLRSKNNDGATALHTAAFFGRIEIVQMLLDSNADKSLKNNFGATARETVMGPFDEIKPIYEMLQQQLGPLGLQIDLMEIEKTRPVIAMMLQ